MQAERTNIDEDLQKFSLEDNEKASEAAHEIFMKLPGDELTGELPKSVTKSRSREAKPVTVASLPQANTARDPGELLQPTL